MSYHLTPDEVVRFGRDGFLSPLSVFTPAEAAALRASFEEFEARVGPEGARNQRTDLHLLLGWAWDLVHDRRIVDRLVSVIGENVLLWSLNWFIKEPGQSKIVTMHQDANYWGLEPHDVVTAWVALSDASAPTGPMEFMPGSHRGELHDHENTYAPDNLLSRGQQVRAELDSSEAVMAPLAAGEMSLHHVRLIHGSGPNTTDDRRIGLVLRYCGTHVRQTKAHDGASLVAGHDDFGHFELFEGPDADFGVEATVRHAESVERMQKIILSD